MTALPPFVVFHELASVSSMAAPASPETETAPNVFDARFGARTRFFVVVRPLVTATPSNVLEPKPRDCTVSGYVAWVAVIRKVPVGPVVAIGVARASKRPSMIRAPSTGLPVEALRTVPVIVPFSAGLRLSKPGTPSVSLPPVGSASLTVLCAERPMPRWAKTE